MKMKLLFTILFLFTGGCLGGTLSIELGAQHHHYENGSDKIDGQSVTIPTMPT